jgi:prepilin-type N-terminal cleavage/methylation domain-containing protein
MRFRVRQKRQDIAGGGAHGAFVVSPEDGFTLAEMMLSAAVLVVVMAAAWLLMTTSNDNSGQASESNRAAAAGFQSDVNHAILPPTGVSPVLVAGDRTCSLLADVSNPPDGVPELVTWSADDTNHLLIRTVQSAPASSSPSQLSSVSSFIGGAVTTTTVLSGLASASDLSTPPMFSYAVSATNSGSNLSTDPSSIGVITFHLRNGLPDKNSNVVDRTSVFRVTAYVINGYSY